MFDITVILLRRLLEVVRAHCHVSAVDGGRKSKTFE